MLWHTVPEGGAGAMAHDPRWWRRCRDREREERVRERERERERDSEYDAGHAEDTCRGDEYGASMCGDGISFT